MLCDKEMDQDFLFTSGSLKVSGPNLVTGEDKCYAFLALLMSPLYDPLCFSIFLPAFILWHLVIYVTIIGNKAGCQ